MSTRTEHIARLTEMSVRAQAIADELAQNVEHGTEYAKQQYGDHLAAKNADIERLTRRAEFAYNALTATHRDTFQRAEDAERQRDQARGDADALAELLVKTADAIGGDPHTSDLPRLVRELRDERDAAVALITAKPEKAVAEPASREAVRDAVAEFDDPCTAIYERSDDEVDDYYCCLRHGHDGDHVNEDGRHWPDAADRDGEDAGQVQAEAAKVEPEEPGFQVGDQVVIAGSTEVGMVAQHIFKASRCVAWTNGNTTEYTRLDNPLLRHVYDADHEPPEGVNVVRDMGTHPDGEDCPEPFLVRCAHSGWDWSAGLLTDIGNGFDWRNAAGDADGALVEWREGDR